MAEQRVDDPDPDAGRTPLSPRRIVRTALEMVQEDGFEAVTMRRVAAALGTGPASLYAHVRGKAELDDRMLGFLCAELALPEPSPARWRSQFVGVCADLRDQYLRYPGISRVALIAAPRSLDTLRISESLLGILLAGGIPARRAAWACDAALLYVAAYGYEASSRARAGGVASAEQRRERMRELPVDRFPLTVAHARELSSGSGHDRFDFALTTLLDGLANRPPAG